MIPNTRYLARWGKVVLAQIVTLNLCPLLLSSASPVHAQLTDPGTGHIYQLVTSGPTQTWNQARDSAMAVGGHLATITSQVEHNFVSALLGSFPSGVIYLGGTDQIVEGQWQWATGEPWSYTNWQPSQPDNSQGIQHYLIGYDEYWDDADPPDGGETYIFEWDQNRVLRVPSQYPTIMAAVNAAFNGDTVLVASGVYNENVDFQKPISVISEEGPESTTIDFIFGVDATSSGTATLEGFSVIAGLSPVVDIVGNSTFTIRNCRFIDFSADQIIQGSSPATLIVERCLFNVTSAGYLIVTTGPNCSIINNTIDGGTSALAIYGANSEVRNNIVVNMGEYGIGPVDPSTAVEYNCFWNNNPNYENSVIPGPGSISSDPIFVNTGLNDYNSPSCRHASMLAILIRPITTLTGPETT